MYENPYPFEQLDEPAWNQMVLKAFFTDKRVERITGLDQRANENLAAILFDYAHERWAAHRPVNIQLWRLAGKLVSENTLPDIRKLFSEGSSTEKQAAALACWQSGYEDCDAYVGLLRGGVCGHCYSLMMVASLSGKRYTTGLESTREGGVVFMKYMFITDSY